MGNSQSQDNTKLKRPSLLDRIKIWLGNVIPIDSWIPLGLLTLISRRSVYRSLNLLPPPDRPESVPSIPQLPYRRPDASGTDVNDLHAGAQNTPFARNMLPNPKPNPLREPSVQLVARRLLERDVFKPAGDQLNVLAGAWIQFMSHDWMRGAQGDENVTLSKGGPGCPLRSFTFQKTKVSNQGTVKNERTHWWDTSVLYGSDAASVASVRECSGGRLVVGETRGLLPRNDDGTLRVGDNMNSWVGVQLLQELFLREHNAVAEFIAREEPHLADDDEALFNIARLVVSAIAAKIHTVDWTVELLDMEVLKVGMLTNWYGIGHGLARTLNLPFFKDSKPPGLLGLVGKKSTTHGVPFALTEEFVSVYRLHPLLPDGLPMPDGHFDLEELVGPKGEQFLCTEKRALDSWDALIKYPCGNLELFNYPRALRDLTTTTLQGKPIDSPVDLAALDLYRDRERGIRNYNDFRRALHMRPINSYEELCGKENVKAINALKEVYGEDGMEDVDFLVGNLAEKKIRGFAISETQFNIFLLMASRRLEADRFLNEDFNENTYTRAGLAWVHGVRNLRDVLERHFPEMRVHFKDRNKSAFKPTTKWPEAYTQPGGVRVTG